MAFLRWVDAKGLSNSPVLSLISRFLLMAAPIAWMPQILGLACSAFSLDVIKYCIEEKGVRDEFPSFRAIFGAQ